MEKKELINIIENDNCNIAKIKDLVGLLVDTYSLNANAKQFYQLVDDYRTTQTLVFTLLDLLIYQEKESNDIIDKIYKEEGASKCM